MLKQQVSPALDVFVRLLRAHAAVTRLFDVQLQAEHGLTLSAYEALLRLSREPERMMRRVDLASVLLLTASGVTRLLEGLEREGYVAREQCASDRRVSYAVLTEAGQEKLAAASKSHVAAVRALFEERFEEDDLHELAAMLNRLPGVDPDASGEECLADPPGS